MILVRTTEPGTVVREDHGCFQFCAHRQVLLVLSNTRGFLHICDTGTDGFSTRDAAKQLGVTATALSRYIAAKKIPTPRTVSTGGITVHLWSRRDIDRVRRLLPKIRNGRKLRHKKEKIE